MNRSVKCFDGQVQFARIFKDAGGFKMAIGLGLGMATYTFSTAKGYWHWVKRCDEARSTLC